MGTRHLIAVKIDGEYKVAQYGQWDGYLSGHGVKILRFLNSRHKKYERFKNRVRKCSFYTEADFELIDSKINDRGFMNVEWSDVPVKWQHVYPQLDRDLCSRILSFVAGTKNKEIKLRNSIKFSCEIGCDYAYVIDFDTHTFEVFVSPHHKKYTDTSRFMPYYDESNRFSRYPMVLFKKFDLNNLPSPKEFLKLDEELYED